MAGRRGQGRAGTDAVRGAVIGTLIGLAVAAALLVSSWRDDADAPSSGAAVRLVETLQRQATKTWKVTGHFERRRDGDSAVIYQLVTVSQQPPRRLTMQAGSAELVDDTTYTLCLAGADAPCAVDVGPSFEARLEAEVAGVRSLTFGADAPYRVVTASGGAARRCFRLERVNEHPAFDRYGDSSRLCFDRRTDALVSSEVRRGAVVDRFAALEVTAKVASTDFVIAGNTAR
jgi:hypothetical protein